MSIILAPLFLANSITLLGVLIDVVRRFVMVISSFLSVLFGPPPRAGRCPAQRSGTAQAK
jgi:hypothetical protein